MGCAHALPLVASLATLANADLRLDVRAEGRTSTLAPEGLAPVTRQALRGRPGATLRIDAVPMRLTATYAATVWTSDVEASPSPLVTQDAQLRLETHHASPWVAQATASAARGWTDPLADPVAALANAGPSQSPALVPIEFEALGAGAGGSFPLDRRTTIAGEASAWCSGAVDPADRAALPMQDIVALQLTVLHLVSPRSTLRLLASASGTRTDDPSGPDESGWASASATWRTRLTRALDGWGGAGVLLSRRFGQERAAEVVAVPIGEMGLVYDRGRGGAELSAQATPFTDRFTGNVAVMYGGRGALRWRESARLSFATTASGGALRSGDTALAALDARGRYALRERLSLEGGIVGRWQRERRSDVPSFAEIGVVVGLAWESGPLAPERTDRADGI